MNNHWLCFQSRVNNFQFSILNSPCKQLIFVALLLNFNFNYISPIQAETVLEKIEKTGLLKVGIRADAVPFGYRDNDNKLRGICLDFIALLREQLKQKINRNIITINLLISSLSSRFDLVENGLVYLECGPNTIRELDEYQVEFSQPFLITGTQLFVKKDLAKKINIDGNLTDLTIGVLRYTTTEEFIKNKYPSAQIELFQGSKGSLRAIQAVQQNRINAFANDGILLRGEAMLLGLSLNEEYTLIPEIPMTCEKYGLILPKNDPTWQDFINTVINVAKQEKISQQWLPILDSQVRKTEEFCH
jgi:polar amino acid transport system substrate-binding protein